MKYKVVQKRFRNFLIISSSIIWNIPLISTFLFCINNIFLLIALIYFSFLTRPHKIFGSYSLLKVKYSLFTFFPLKADNSYAYVRAFMGPRYHMAPRGCELPTRCWEPDPDLSKSSKCPQQSQFLEPDPQSHILKNINTSLSANFLSCFIPCTSKVLSNSARKNNHKGKKPEVETMEREPRYLCH